MATNGGTNIVQKLWNHCNVLRDDGLSYQDYLEQVATLLFLKMAHEQSEFMGRTSIIPSDSEGRPLD
jgi:type I restriction enzyme M protein